MQLLKLEPFFKLFNESMPEIHTATFSQRTLIPKCMGLYAIFQGERCMYAGKGKVPTRIMHHYNKAYENWISSTGNRNSTTDTRGWKELREQEWFKPDEWTIEYFVENNSISRSAYEGIMIKLFNPYANDEVMEHRNQSISTYM